MKIVVDENMPYAQEAFAHLGEVVAAPGRAIDNAILKDADALMVRSITKVNAALLENTPVRFVGTATIGEDHVDKAWLREQGIRFTSAPGCNATSVAEYIVAALLELARKHDLRLQGKRLGIVGCGNVGSRVLKRATALGLQCVVNDPPLARSTCEPFYQDIEAIWDCDFVTVHVPLTKEGQDRTWRLVNDTFLAKLKPGAILLNSSRGPVADGNAIGDALDSGHLLDCVLDVWENEPNIDVTLLNKIAIATPHIAGYSFDAKVRGTTMVYEAYTRFLEVEATWDAQSALPPPDCPELALEGEGQECIRHAVKTIYDIMADDARMRRIVEEPESDRGAYFDTLRKTYPRRREFALTRISGGAENASEQEQLRGMGFRGA